MRAFREKGHSTFLFCRRTTILAATAVCILVMVTSHCFIEPAEASLPDVQRTQSLEQEEEYVPGEVLLLLSADVDSNGEIANAENLSGVEEAVGGVVERRLALSRGKEVMRVKLPEGKSVEDAIAENWGARDRRILLVEPNYRVRIARTPNDSLFPELWGMHNTGQTGGTNDADIDAPEAWDIATGVPVGSDVIVGVIDTGIDYMHPDLAANMWVNPGEIPGNGIDDERNGFVDDVYGYDFYEEDSDPSDAAGHGTHCAGTIAGVGDNGFGVAGVNWCCKLMALRFLNAGGGGSTGDAIEAVIYGVNNGAKILSNSWGGGGYSETLEAAIMYARDNGVLFVAAAGNWGTNTDSEPYYPAGYDVSNVISVAATDDEDKLASFSNFGEETVDMGAPGVNILSTVPKYRTLFYEDFQGATIPTFTGTQMTKEGGGNYWGTVLSPIYYDANNIAARGDWSNSWPYSSGSYGSIVTPPFDTRGLRGVSLYFEFRCESDYNEDELAAYVWDGNTWREVFSINGPWYYYEDFFFGTRVDIPDSCLNSGMKVRFRWFTDNEDNNYFGAEVDNILVQCIEDDTENYGLNSGTSMATPHVAGVAALVMANPPSTTPIPLQELKTRLVWTGDPIPALDGKTVSGCRLNAYNALTAAPGVTVAVPNGGESWELSSIYNIRWYSIEGGPTVDIILLKGGEVYMQLADNVENNGKFTWEIPVSLPGDSDYRIRIINGTNTDESDEDFELKCPAMPTPFLPSPPDGASNVSLDTNLKWHMGNREGETIDFDEVGDGTPVNGMIIGDVTFGFSSYDAYIIGGSGGTKYVELPCIEGDADGTYMTLDFAIPVYSVSYSFVLSVPGPNTLMEASTMVLLDSSLNTIGSFSADAADMGYYWIEGVNSYTGIAPIAHAVITFASPNPEIKRFLMDNVSYNAFPGGLPEAPTAAKGGVADASEGGEYYTEGSTSLWPRPEEPAQAMYLLPGVRPGVETGEKEPSTPEDTDTANACNINALHRGGPDEGDYIFIDSDEPNGPTFDWIDLPTLPPPNMPPPPPPPPGASEPESLEPSDPKILSAMNLHLYDDSYFYPIMLPFSFTFYGTKYNNLAIGSNGAIYFEDEYFDYGNSCIPCSFYIQRFIAVYWDDLYPNQFGDDNVYVAIVGEAPSRIFVVQWENVRFWGRDTRVTCQAQLFEGSNDILLLYADPSLEAGLNAVVGIQRDPQCGLNYMCYERGLHPGLAILFQHKPPCPTKWDVYFGEDPNAMELIGSDMTTTLCDPTPEPDESLKKGTRYYWQVVMKNCCNIVDGNEWSFTTENTRPIADAGDDQTIECLCNTEQGTKVTLDGTESSDADGNPLTYTWMGPFIESPVQGATPTVTLEDGCPGDYVITLVVNDGIDDSEPNEVVVTVVDTKPPEFEFSVLPTMLWPPNHKMVEITPSWTVNDECDASPDVSLVGIVANEDGDTIGDGHTSVDIETGDDGSIFVRSERSGTSTGRIYTITYQAVDDSGNATVRSATVSIPHEFKLLARMGDQWLRRNLTGNLPEDLNGDGIVNLKDIAIFANNWILE